MKRGKNNTQPLDMRTPGGQLDVSKTREKISLALHSRAAASQSVTRR